MRAEWLVVPGWVGGELADELAGSGVDDADVRVLGPGCGRPHFVAGADVVEAAVGAEGGLPAGSVRTRLWMSAVRSPGAALGRAA